MKRWMILAMLLAGCGLGPRPDPLAPYRAAVLRQLTADPLSDSATTTVVQRNATLNAFVMLVDQEYAEYERGLYANNGALEVFADMLVMGTSAASTAGTSIGLKTALSAATAAITGTRVSIEKNLFEQQSRLALIARMRAGRGVVMARIELGKRRPVREYSLSDGMLDVEALSEAGTVTSALQGITEDALSSLATAQIQLGAARKTPAAGE
jgi:hypothetical protein